MKANTPAERLVNGIIKENPTFVLVLGMCPTLAVTTSAINGIGMGLTTTVVLAMLAALQNKFKIGAAKRRIDPSEGCNCCSGCDSCSNTMCKGGKQA